MGWNSFDAYDCRIDEGQFRRTVNYMAANLKPSFLAAVGEATEAPRRSPGRAPPYWKSRVLRRQALAEEDDGQGGWVQETA